MSGHSHFKTIKAQKDLADAKKGKVFSKFARLITIAVKERGPDVITNPQLKTAIERAKQFNMPKDNIERAIKKGTGELVGENLEEISFEGFGPGGFALIIEGITDNKNRALGEIKSILQKHRGKIANEGAVKWMFEQKGCIESKTPNKPKDQIELELIELGAEDIEFTNDTITVYTKKEDLEKVKQALEEGGFAVENSFLGWLPKEKISPPENNKEKLEKFFEELDENEAVQNVYSNLLET